MATSAKSIAKTEDCALFPASSMRTYFVAFLWAMQKKTPKKCLRTTLQQSVRVSVCACGWVSIFGSWLAQWSCWCSWHSTRRCALSTITNQLSINTRNVEANSLTASSDPLPWVELESPADYAQNRLLWVHSLPGCLPHCRTSVLSFFITSHVTSGLLKRHALRLPRLAALLGSRSFSFSLRPLSWSLLWLLTSVQTNEPSNVRTECH